MLMLRCTPERQQQTLHPLGTLGQLQKILQWGCLALGAEVLA